MDDAVYVRGVAMRCACPVHSCMTDCCSRRRPSHSLFNFVYQSSLSMEFLDHATHIRLLNMLPTVLQDEADEGSQRSVILDGSPKSVRRLEQPRLQELEGGPSSHLAPFGPDSALLERSAHGILPNEMVCSFSFRRGCQSGGVVFQERVIS